MLQRRVAPGRWSILFGRPRHQPSVCERLFCGILARRRLAFGTRRWHVFELIGGILILIAVLTFISFALVGLGIYGAAKGLSAVFRRLTGKTRRPRAMGPSKDSSRQSQHTAPSPVEAPPRPQAHPYVHLDVDGGATAQGIEDVMRAYTHERVVGPYAQAAMQSLAMARRREASLMSEIDSRFSPRSISWNHFASTVQEALDAILRNCALLANRVQTFDIKSRVIRKMPKWIPAKMKGEAIPVKMELRLYFVDTSK